MNDPHCIRERVAESYTEALTASHRAADLLALAGYTSEEVASLPADATADSFGCGNPLAFGDVLEGQTVLDLGSGAGMDLLLAARRVGPTGRVIGVDMTDAMIERAGRNVTAAGVENVEVRKGNIEALPVASGTVDWVISNCVVSLSPDKGAIFAEIARVLAPGGRFIISDIVVDDRPALVRRSLALCAPNVAAATDEEAYLEGLAAAGLVDLEVKGRTVYDATTLRAYFLDEVGRDGLTGRALDASGVMGLLARHYAGKVWSAKLAGRKPPSTPGV